MDPSADPIADLAALRVEFDQGFARAAQAARAPGEYLLAVRVNGVPYALRVAEIAGIVADRRIVPLPTPLTALLGLAALRGQLLPVYDLGLLLGRGAQTRPRWLVLLGRDCPIALAFEAFEGQLLLAPDDLIAAPAAGYPHVGGALPTSEGLRPLIDLASVQAEIRRQAAPSPTIGANAS